MTIYIVVSGTKSVNGYHHIYGVTDKHDIAMGLAKKYNANVLIYDTKDAERRYRIYCIEGD